MHTTIRPIASGLGEMTVHLDPGDRCAVAGFHRGPDHPRIVSPIKTLDDTMRLEWKAAEITAQPGEHCGWAVLAEDGDTIVYADTKHPYVAGEGNDYQLIGAVRS